MLIVRATKKLAAVPGAGLTGQLDGRRVRLARPGRIDPHKLADTVARMQASGATAVLVKDDGRLLGAIAVRDGLRPKASEPSPSCTGAATSWPCSLATTTPPPLR